MGYRRRVRAVRGFKLAARHAATIPTICWPMLDTGCNDLRAAVGRGRTAKQRGMKAEPINLAAPGADHGPQLLLRDRRSHDCSFPPTDCAAECRLIAGARFRAAGVGAGHRAAGNRARRRARAGRDRAPPGCEKKRKKIPC